MTDPLVLYIRCLETLERDTIADLLSQCDADLHFRDPFNDCRGAAAFGRIMNDMFDKLDGVHFTADHFAWSDNDKSCALAHWTLRARLRVFGNNPWLVEGCTLLRFGDNGKVTAHYDYWDAAAGLYERVPIVGFVLRLLRRRIRAE